jgi:hypothetical protein
MISYPKERFDHGFLIKAFVKWNLKELLIKYIFIREKRIF